MFRIHWQKTLRSPEFQAAFALLLSVAAVGFLANLFAVWGRALSFVPPANQQFIEFSFGRLSSAIKLLLNSFFIPLCAGLAGSSLYYEDLRSGMLDKLLTRSRRKNYYFSALCNSAVSGVTLVTLPLLMNFLFCLVAFPFDSPATIDNQPAFTYFRLIDFLVLKELFWQQPYLYNLLYLGLAGLLGGLYAALAYCVSLFYAPNKFFVISLPFFLSLLFTLAVALLGKNHLAPGEQLDAAVATEINSLSYLLMLLLCLSLACLLAVVIKIYAKKDELG